MSVHNVPGSGVGAGSGSGVGVGVGVGVGSGGGTTNPLEGSTQDQHDRASAKSMAIGFSDILFVYIKGQFVVNYKNKMIGRHIKYTFA